MSETTDTTQKILFPETGHPAIEEFKQHAPDYVHFEPMSNEAAVAKLKNGEVAAVITGSTEPTAAVIRTALEQLNPRRNEHGEVDRENGKRKLISSFFLFDGRDGQDPFILADAAVIQEPTAEMLADIAAETAINASKLGIEPSIAFLSFSTLGSASGPAVEKVRQAYELFHAAHPEIPAIGEVQFDAATDEEIYRQKTGLGYPEGKKPTIFIASSLDVGNTLYKALQFGGWTAVGPLLQGFEDGLQLHDLSRGVKPEALPIIAKWVAKLSGLDTAHPDNN